MAKIIYPYLPEGRSFKYVNLENQYMHLAKIYARAFSIDTTMPDACVIVKDNKIIGLGANGSDYHKDNECERVKRNIPSGEGYELCEGCHPKNHNEPRAIADAIAKGNEKDLQGADLYQWGHWWSCQWCWDKMIKAGIKDVYLLTDSEVLFNKNNKANIVGHQIDIEVKNNRLIAES